MQDDWNQMNTESDAADVPKIDESEELIAEKDVTKELEPALRGSSGIFKNKIVYVHVCIQPPTCTDPVHLST